MSTNWRIQPENPIKAVTHPDPYPYYQMLIKERPIYFDESLHLWVAASADAVQAVLTSEICRVRRTTELVPKHLHNSAAADIFQHLVRMNERARHRPMKQAV